MAIGTASWLLQSVLHCEKAHEGASLRDIIAFGDFVNHAVFTFAEFSAATQFLTERGALAANEHSLKTSDSFRTWYKKHVPSRARPNYEQERKLFAEYLIQVLPENSGGKGLFSEQEFRAAVDSYLLNGQ